MMLVEGSGRWTTRDLALAGVYIWTNTIFFQKYVARVSVHVPVLAAAFVAAEILLVWLMIGAPLTRLAAIVDRRRYAILAIGLACLLTAMLLAIPQGANRVGRYPAIHAWLGRLLRGEFPYADTVNPSGFPMLFALAFPFYLIGDIGLLQIAAFLAFAWLLVRRHAPAGAARRLALLVLSPAFLYEVVVRSELFSNMILVLLVLQYLESQSQHGTRRVRSGVLAGLALSTRAVVGVPYAVMFAFLYRRRAGDGALVALIALAVFIATLLPFAAWDWSYFIARGPFAVQGQYAPAWFLALALAAAAAAGYRVTSAQAALAACALVLSGIVSAVLLARVMQEGWYAASVGEGAFDIGYFCFAVPFALMALGNSSGATQSPSRC